MKRLLALLLVLALTLGLCGCQFAVLDGSISTSQLDCPINTQLTPPSATKTDPDLPDIDENGVYNSKEDVALYIHIYGRLPSNYVTKDEARALGCESLGHIGDYLEDGAIGGDVFKNREGLLPKKSGRTYYECDIDTWNKTSRGAKRIVFSNDGLVYYTDDHYESFTLLYGEP